MASSSVEVQKAYSANRAIIFDVAKGYVEAGLAIVCVHSALCNNKVRRGKAPTHAKWQVGKLSWPELYGEMERVWAKEGGVNIGLRTGRDSGIICIDIDEKSGGLAWYYENESHLGRPIIERTGNKGIHLYYRYPRGLGAGEVIRTRSSGARLFQGVDILADGAGQVVTWPSIHAATGEEYRFDNNLSLLDVAHEADELPEWLLEMLRVSETPRDAGDGQDEGNGEGEADVIDVQQAIHFLRQYPAAREGDGGDLTTLRAAMVCKDYGLNFSQVLEVMAREYNPRCTPPWSNTELRLKVANAFKYGKLKPGINSMESMFPQAQDVASMADRAAQAAKVIDPKKTYSKKNPVHSANLFVERHREVLKCFNDDWYLYDEKSYKWTRVNDIRVELMIYADMAKVSANGQVVMTARASLFTDIRKVVRLLLNKHVEALPMNQWLDGREDSGEYIAFENGLLNVKTMELRAHDPALFNFTVLPFAYDPSATCPRFMEFLSDVWDGDEELIEALRLWFGYVLLPQANAQRFALFHGASRGGKSTIVNLLAGLVGNRNVAWPTVSGLSGEFGLQNVFGCRVVVIPEADKIARDKLSIAAERIKCIASNDVMEINRKGESFIYEALNAKLAIVCNEMPQFVNQQGSLTNRMIVFPFWKSYQGKEDFDLGDKLRSEIAGIFNWAVIGARMLADGEAKLFTAMRGIIAHQEISEQIDDVEAFMAEAIEFNSDESVFVSNNQLWQAYKTWAKESGRHAKNKQHFLSLLMHKQEIKSRKVRRQSDKLRARGVTRVRLIDVTLVGDVDGPMEPDVDF